MCAHEADPYEAKPHEAEIEDFRRKRVIRLLAEDGWLAVTGLHWLDAGANDLPIGTVTLEGNVARIGTETIPFEPALLRRGGQTWQVIRRGDAVAVRVRDPAARPVFAGLDYFPIDAEWRIVADFITYDPPRVLPVVYATGQESTQASPGAARFTVDGREFRLDATVDGSQLFFIFADETTGYETYGAGRFVYADMPASGQVVLDFNRAINPPCALTDFATCPMVPAQNRLALRITAGEKRPRDPG